MPTIKIKTCSLTPNYCALEAVGMFMLANYKERIAMTTRVLTVTSGRKIKVEELAHKKGMSICSCSFKTTTVLAENGHTV